MGSKFRGKRTRGKIQYMIVTGIVISLILAICFSTPVFSYDIDRAIEYLKSRQNAEGGFSEPNESPDERLTSWALLAGISNSEKASSLLFEGSRAISFIISRSSNLSDLGDIALCVVALSCAGVDVQDIEGKNLISLVKSFAESSGKIGKSLEDHCWAIIALASGGEKISGKYIEWLLGQQREDGGWGDENSDVITQTSLAIEALVCSGSADESAIEHGLLFIRNQIQEDGGFPGKDGISNALSTAYALRAIYAAGDNPLSEAWDFHGSNPVRYLESLQSADGHFLYTAGKDYQPLKMTALSIIALEKKHLPLGIQSAGVSLKLDVSGFGTIDEMGEFGATEQGKSIEGASRSKNEGQRFRGGEFVRTKSWINSFWYFAFASIAYLALLVISALIARKLR